MLPGVPGVQRQSPCQGSVDGSSPSNPSRASALFLEVQLVVASVCRSSIKGSRGMVWPWMEFDHSLRNTFWTGHVLNGIATWLSQISSRTTYRSLHSVCFLTRSARQVLVASHCTTVEPLESTALALAWFVPNLCDACDNLQTLTTECGRQFHNSLPTLSNFENIELHELHAKLHEGKHAEEDIIINRLNRHRLKLIKWAGDGERER